MAIGEQPPKHLLTLIRDFATERSQGERRVTDLKKRLLDLHADTDAANADLESAKVSKETAELQFKGFQVQLSMTDASIHAQQARISLLQEEISKVGADLAALKSEEGVQRDEFISTMYEFNTKIRQFQESTLHAFRKQDVPVLPSDKAIVRISKEEVPNVQDLKCLEDEITSINAQQRTMEVEYEKELHDQEEARMELVSAETRVFFAEAVMEETKQLQELGRYPLS